MARFKTVIKAETIIQDLILKKRFDLLFQIMSELDPVLRKAFLNEILHYVLSDSKLTTEVFRKNIRTAQPKKTRRIELTPKEASMVKNVSKEIKKLEQILKKG